MKIFKNKLTYEGKIVTLELSYYIEPYNNALIMLSEEGSLVATCSTNIEPLGYDNLIFIKDYSENEGMLEFLIKNDVIVQVLGKIETGYVEVPICELNLDKFIYVEEN